MLRRDHWRQRHELLDPVTDAQEILTNVATREFPWDAVNALSFALFRTFAVPSIGGLLHRTGEFTERTQKRYDDTALLLEHVLRFGLQDPQGRAAVRRINQMHGQYDISNDDMRYVLATFVVVPPRWIERFGYRPLSPVEVAASTGYYAELGRLMGIKDIPATFDEFADLLDRYEDQHFAYDEGSRAVAEATLDLLTTFPPQRVAPRWLVRRFAYALMDEPLRTAFGFPRPILPERLAYLALLRARRMLIGLLPARRRQKYALDFGYIRTYSQRYDVEDLGVLPPQAADHRIG